MAVTEFDPPERFVVGTVGPPGERQFFLQARSGIRVSTVSLEKQQVSILADRMLELLEPYRPHRYRVLRLMMGSGQRPPRRAPRSRRTDIRRR